MTKSSYFLEYTKLHLISLEQDLQSISPEQPLTDRFFMEGQIEATKHLLSVAFDIMKSSNERYNNE